MRQRYDDIGHGYVQHRQADPAIAATIDQALGAARTVVNVGAGAGSYEPIDRVVLAVEPSSLMAAQRSLGRPAIRGVAQDLPLYDQSIDAAMTVLSMHTGTPTSARASRSYAR